MPHSTQGADAFPRLDSAAEPDWNTVRRLGFGFIFSFITLHLALQQLYAIATIQTEVGLLPGGAFLQSVYE